MASFLEHIFDSFEEFTNKFEEFKQENNAMFRTKSSETAIKANLKSKNRIPSHFVYSRVNYVCTHYGEPRYRTNGRENGVRSKKHSATGCKASFVLKYNYYEKHLHITNAHMDHNHPTTPETFAQEYQVKRLKKTERESLEDIVELNPQNENLMHIVNTKFNKAYTLAEIRRMKHQLKSRRVRGDVDDLLDNLEEMQSHGQVNVQTSGNQNVRLLQEARHYRTEAALARLSCLLRMSGSLEFKERIEKIERAVQAWEDGKDLSVFDVDLGQDRHLGDGAVVGDEVIGDGVAQCAGPSYAQEVTIAAPHPL